MIPIIAVVTEDAFHALNDLASSTPDPPPDLAAVMERNGWTLNAVLAGGLIGRALASNEVNEAEQ